MGTVSDQFNGSVWPWFVIWCSASPHLRHGAGMLMCVRVWTACLCSCECMRATLHPVELAFNLDSKKKKKKQQNKPEEQSNSSPPHTHTHITFRSGSSSFLTHNVLGQNPRRKTIQRSTIFSESCGSVWQMRRDNYIYLVFRAMAGDAFLQLKWFLLSACVCLRPFYLHCCVRASGYKLIVWKGVLNIALIFHAFPTRCRLPNH